MLSYPFVTIILIIANSVISYRGLNNNAFFDGYKFEVGKVLQNKDYLRMVSSGFLHVSWPHLIFNMITLYAFGSLLEVQLGIGEYLLIYFAAEVGGSVFALFIHRNHPDYNSAGASGAIAGLVFAFIALYPGAGIGILFLPISIPTWLYGLLYILFTIYGVRSKRDNIGHEAHLGGAIIGMMVAILLHPDVIVPNWLPILIVLVPTIGFIYVILRKPHMLMVQNRFFENHEGLTIDDRYNISRSQRRQEIDRILEKIHSRGIRSLTKKEKQILDEYSDKA